MREGGSDHRAISPTPRNCARWAIARKSLTCHPWTCEPSASFGPFFRTGDAEVREGRSLVTPGFIFDFQSPLVRRPRPPPLALQRNDECDKRDARTPRRKGARTVGKVCNAIREENGSVPSGSGRSESTGTATIGRLSPGGVPRRHVASRLGVRRLRSLVSLLPCSLPLLSHSHPPPQHTHHLPSR